MANTAEGFWQDYLGALPAAHPHRHLKPDVFSFGDEPALADTLAELVRAGRKRATASLPVEFTCLGQPLPKAGDVAIVTTAGGVPVAILELTEVRFMPIREVDAAFAADEGEGDGTLASWRAAHQKYFGRVSARHGIAFDEDTAVLCQRFRVVWDGMKT